MLLLTGPNSSELMVSDDYRDAVPAEATVFLCAVGVILVLLLLAFIYMNKRLCMHELDGSCCEDLLRQQKQHPSRSSIESREDDDDSCSDGDDELMQRLRAVPASTKPRYSSPRLAHRAGRGSFITSHSFDSECVESAARHDVDSKRPRSLLSTGISYERPSLYRQFSLQPIVTQDSGLSTSGTTGRKDAPHFPRRLNGDLTPVERSKLSGTISTSCSSSSSSTTSAEDDSLCSLRHRDVRRYRTLCSGRQRTVHATTDADPGLFEETPDSERRLAEGNRESNGRNIQHTIRRSSSALGIANASSTDATFASRNVNPTKIVAPTPPVRHGSAPSGVQPPAARQPPTDSIRRRHVTVRHQMPLPKPKQIPLLVSPSRDNLSQPELLHLSAASSQLSEQLTKGCHLQPHVTVNSDQFSNGQPAMKINSAPAGSESQSLGAFVTNRPQMISVARLVYRHSITDLNAVPVTKQSSSQHRHPDSSRDPSSVQNQSEVLDSKRGEAIEQDMPSELFKPGSLHNVNAGEIDRYTYTVENIPKCRKPIHIRRHILSRQHALDRSSPMPIRKSTSWEVPCSHPTESEARRRRWTSLDSENPGDYVEPRSKHSADITSSLREIETDGSQHRMTNQEKLLYRTTPKALLRQGSTTEVDFQYKTTSYSDIGQSLHAANKGSNDYHRQEPASTRDEQYEPSRKNLTHDNKKYSGQQLGLPPTTVRRRLLPATPQSSVESAPAAICRNSPRSSPHLSTGSTPCLAIDSTPTSSAPPSASKPHYFRYSDFLIFPMQYFSPADGQTVPTGSLPRNSGSQNTSSVGDLNTIKSREEPARLRLQVRRSLSAPGQPRASVNSGQPKPHNGDITKSLPSLLDTGPGSKNNSGITTLRQRLFPSFSFDRLGKPRQKATGPRSDGYDPYDPYRPVYRRPPKSSQRRGTQSKSLLNLEWKILKDRLFDVADLTSGGSGALSRCGALEVACAYDSHTRKLSVQLLQARDVPTRDRGGASTCQVRLVLLPGKKQRLRSRMQSGENPHFNEAFVFNRIEAGDVSSMGVRLRLYGCERLRRERLIGENVLPFSSANVEQQIPQWVTLLPRALISITSDGSVGEVSSLCRSESTSSTQSIHRGGVPELLVGLQYSAITGRLAVEIIKGSHFRTANSSRAPDTYVRLNLLSGNRHEIGRGKTSVRRAQPNPLFKETFMFQVPLFQLADVTLMVSVYYKRNMKKRDLLGWFSLGWSSSDDEGRSHWLDARDASGIQICRWHMLCEQ